MGELQEKRQGKISRRRQHSNSFGRRPPSPVQRPRSAKSKRSISPSPSGTSPTANKYAKVDEQNKHKGKINQKQVWNMPATDGVFQTANSLKATPKSSSSNGRPKRKMKPRRR